MTDDTTALADQYARRDDDGLFFDVQKSADAHRINCRLFARTLLAAQAEIDNLKNEIADDNIRLRDADAAIARERAEVVRLKSEIEDLRGREARLLDVLEQYQGDE